MRAASFTGILAGCRPPAGIRELLVTGSAAHPAPRPPHPIYLWADMLTRVWSPYQANFSNYYPLRELLQDIDFEGLRDDVSAPRVFICATNVRTGLRRVFHNAELSVDVCSPRRAYEGISGGPDRGRLLLGRRLHRKPGACPSLPRHERDRSDRRGHQPHGAHDRAADCAWHNRPRRRNQL
jgi:hypothetical protein